MKRALWPRQEPEQNTGNLTGVDLMKTPKTLTGININKFIPNFMLKHEGTTSRRTPLPLRKRLLERGRNGGQHHPTHEPSWDNSQRNCSWTPWLISGGTYKRTGNLELARPRTIHLCVGSFPSTTCYSWWNTPRLSKAEAPMCPSILELTETPTLRIIIEEWRIQRKVI